MKRLISDAIHWWEPKRLVYNGVLTVFVLMRFYQGYPATRRALEFNSLLMLVGLAIAANISYCAAYIPDLFVQLAGHDKALPNVRWVIFGVGLVFSLVLAHFWSTALLGIG